jgi:phospholipase/carboxylesterase
VIEDPTRRQFLTGLVFGFVGTVVAGCRSASEAEEPLGALNTQVPAAPPTPHIAQAPARPTLPPPTAAPTITVAPQATLTATAAVMVGRLQARPAAPRTGAEPRPGRQPLGLTAERDTLLYVPQGYQDGQPLALIVLLHGAGGTAEHGLSLLQAHADTAGLLLLAPASRGRTWDLILGGFGPDVALIDRALVETFGRFSVDPARCAVGGFSDGASYALSLGLTNGDLFSHAIAFSPGFMAPQQPQGKPRLFISHGTRDDVLPIDVCSRRIVPEVQEAGYDVRYREFDGPHTVPADIAQEAVVWLTAGRS